VLLSTGSAAVLVVLNSFGGKEMRLYTIVSGDVFDGSGKAMNIFKQISSWLGERRKARYCRAVKNPRAMKEDRWLALTALGEYDDPQFAVPALLARFEYNLDNGILDTREKDQAMKSLLRYDKEAVLAMARKHLRATDHIAWTAKLLLQLGGEKEVANALLACLDLSDVAFDRAKVDKNYDVLCHLRDFDVSDLSRDIVHFLNDNDERVRFATAEILIKQKADYAAEVLEKFISDDSAENTRLRQSVLAAFIANGWTIKNRHAFRKSSAAREAIISKNGKLKPIQQRQ